MYDSWMGPGEIRAIRGSLSRAAFARLLGVTPLTVLRWELEDGDKEARRPRQKMVEALKKLARDGVPNVSQPPPTELPDAVELSGDDAKVLPLLDRLMTEEWARAEDELIVLLGSGSLSKVGRALGACGIVQTQLFCRLDIRGAFTTMLPVLAEAEAGELPPPALARVLVMSAVLFGAPDSRVFNPGRANALADRADNALGAHEHDLRIFLVIARMGAARFLAPTVALRAFEAAQENLEHAVSPLAKLVVAGTTVRVRGDSGSTAARELADRLNMGGLATVAMAERAWRQLRVASPPEVVLMLSQLVREKVESTGVPPAESLLLSLACECEARCRRGQFAEANEVLAYATKVAKRERLPAHALAVPAARLHVYTNRVNDQVAFAAWLEEARLGSSIPAAELYAKSIAKMLQGDVLGATELADRASSAVEGGTGVDYVVHDARIQALETRFLQRDLAGARALFPRFEALLEERPSVWHTALFLRLEGCVHAREGKTQEARQKLESSLSTFQLVSDDVQIAFCRASLALLATQAGAPDANAQTHAARAELERLKVTLPAMLMPSSPASMPPRPPAPWTEESLADRVAVAVERLSVRGLPPDLLRSELASILGELFDGRDAKNAEEQSAIETLTQAAVPKELSDDLEDVPLPGFIAEAPLTRRLKREIAQLSRCSATILIGGESGSGKEVVARAVHDLSARSDRSYVAFNCASIPRDLFEGQLFGYRKGAFTGATSDSSGVIRAADGGTLFLTKLASYRSTHNPSCCGSWKMGRFSRWVSRSRAAWTSECWRLRIAIWANS
jgi:hypothetical protein